MKTSLLSLAVAVVASGLALSAAGSSVEMIDLARQRADVAAQRAAEEHQAERMKWEQKEYDSASSDEEGYDSASSDEEGYGSGGEERAEPPTHNYETRVQHDQVNRGIRGGNVYRKEDIQKLSTIPEDETLPPLRQQLSTPHLTSARDMYRNGGWSDVGGVHRRTQAQMEQRQPFLTVESAKKINPNDVLSAMQELEDAEAASHVHFDSGRPPPPLRRWWDTLSDVLREVR